MSDTQNTYSSSNLYAFWHWANTDTGDIDYDFNNLSIEGGKRAKKILFDLPKELEESGKSYLGLSRK